MLLFKNRLLLYCFTVFLIKHDSTTENGTNSRDENFVIQSDDIDDKLYSSESDSVEQRPDAAGAEAAKLKSATAAAATSSLRCR